MHNLDWQALLALAARVFPHVEQALSAAPQYGASMILQEPAGWRITWQQDNPQVREFREQFLRPIARDAKDLLGALPMYVPLNTLLSGDMSACLEQEKGMIVTRLKLVPAEDTAINQYCSRIDSIIRVQSNMKPRWVGEQPLVVIWDEALRQNPSLCPWLVVFNSVLSWEQEGKLRNKIDTGELTVLEDIYSKEELEKAAGQLSWLLSSAADRYQPGLSLVF